MSRKHPKMLPVTDHAVLRWLERFGYVDVDAIRRKIYDDVRDALNAGATKVTINGSEYRIEGGVVVTLINKGRKTCLQSGKRK